jgi:macrolide-specific efflux system membrane fusion protein
MKNKIWKFVVLGAFVAAGGWGMFRATGRALPPEEVREITPYRGAIQSVISTTGSVLPKNRLEIKPPVNGRIEAILAKEGDHVKAAQIVAQMSSTERAALLDNARGQGAEALAYWQDAYKPIPLLAPIDGEVIVATTQPGQAVTTADAVIVLSDHLIVRAQVDETDIGKIRLGQKAILALDAYPDTKISSAVEHIYYESETVNNVTIYKVDLVPDEVPAFFRSGMNVSIDFIEQGRLDALLIPVGAVVRDKSDSYVLLKDREGQAPVKARVTLGISDDKNVEVLSGLKETDTIILKSEKYRLPKSDTGTNPFMPPRRR